MKINIKLILVVIIILGLIIIIISYPFKNDLVDKYYCNSDSDCITEQCCHPYSCIHRNFKPDCEDIACSSDCVPDTLDCGQGSCKCIDNKCQAVMNLEE